jgi:hypothetical protein
VLAGELLTRPLSAEFPEDKVGALETNEHITVEADSEVKTQ